MVLPVQSRINPYTHRGSKTQRALSRTVPLHLEKGLGQRQLDPICAECCARLLCLSARASITGNLAAHQSSAAAIISTATPSQWENLLGDALCCHTQRWLAPFCRQVHPVQGQTEQVFWGFFSLSLALGTSTLGSRCKWCLFLFLMDLTQPDVVYESNTGGGCPQVSPELSAVERFPCLERFKRKQLLKSCRAEKGPLTLGGTWRAMATNTSAQTKPSGARRWTTAESWGTLSLHVHTPHLHTLSDRPRMATGTKPLPRDTAPHASKPV